MSSAEKPTPEPSAEYAEAGMFAFRLDRSMHEDPHRKTIQLILDRDKDLLAAKQAELDAVKAELIASNAELADWRDLGSKNAMAPLGETIWPNNWHQDCASVAFRIHQAEQDLAQARAALAGMKYALDRCRAVYKYTFEHSGEPLTIEERDIIQGAPDLEDTKPFSVHDAIKEENT